MIRDNIIKTLSDKNHIRRNAAIQICIVTIAFIMLMRVYPMQMYEKHICSGQKAFNTSTRTDLNGERFTSSDKKLQTVYFSHSHLYSIVLYLDCTLSEGTPEDENILFRLYDEGFGCVYETGYDCADIHRDGQLRAVPDIDVATDKAYYHEIVVPENVTAEVILPIAFKSALSQPENSSLYIDGIVNDESCLIADFNYCVPLTAVGIAGYYLLIIIIAAVSYILIMYVLGIYDSRYLKYNDMIIRYARIASSVVLAAAAVFSFIFSVVLNKFGTPMPDRIFFAVGIIMAVLWAEAAIWIPCFYPMKKKQTEISAGKQIFRIWRNYIQTVSFGLLFYSLCQYVNAEREYYHYTNTRWALIFMALALLMVYNEKQLLNKISCIWVILSFVCSCLYCNGFKEDESELVLAQLTCGVVVSWGLLVINILLHTRASLIKDKIKSLTRGQAVYGILWVVFAAFMLVYRYEKTWVFTAVFPFAVMFFMDFSPSSKSRFLKNLTDGILLSFWLVTLFCLMHRPHHYWMLYRYSGLFHTVACTGMYLAVVLGAAVGQLYGRLKSTDRMFIRCYNEYFTAAAVVAFIVLTMSRTAFLTSAVTIGAVTVLAAVTYRKTPKRILQETGMLLAASVISFPMIYSAVRTVPALINDPVRYDVEFQDDSFMICEGDPINSDKYMTVERFFSALFGRMGNDKDGLQGSISINRVGLIAYSKGLPGEVYMTAYSDDDLTENSIADEKKDISNGRFDIFREYFKALSFGGHPYMGFEDENGREKYGHAHNSYLQIAYNFGIIAGVVFLLICICAFWYSVRLMYTQGRKYPIYMVPFALIVVFGFVSLTEWAFHPCIPAGFCFLVLQIPLMCE